MYVCFPPRKLHLYYRSERDIANKHSIVHNTGQLALHAAALGTVNSIVARHGLLLSGSPLHIYDFVAFFLARERSPCTLLNANRGLRRAHMYVLLEVSSTAFCAEHLYETLHEAMRSPNASYSREPNAFLVDARSACCLCRRCAG